MTYRDETDEDWSDDYDTDDGGEDDEASEPTAPCPYCGAEIHEDAQRCPQCGQYISAEDSPVARQRWWIVLGAIAVMYIVYRWTVG
jgi:predicted nucleic acid-binding Zn ribbon protein